MSLNLTPEESNVYSAYFSQLDQGSQGGLGTAVCVNFFQKSGLSQEVLGAIWQQVDTGRGIFTPREFCVALKLIALAQNGRQPILANLNNPVPLPFFNDGAPSASASPSPSPWASASQKGGKAAPSMVITPEERDKFKLVFDAKQKNGKIEGSDGRNLLMSSNLPHDSLKTIWLLADLDKDGALTLPEFMIVMHLLQLVRTGALATLPASLPPSLIDSANSLASSASSRPASGLPPPLLASSSPSPSPSPFNSSFASFSSTPAASPSVSMPPLMPTSSSSSSSSSPPPPFPSSFAPPPTSSLASIFEAGLNEPGIFGSLSPSPAPTPAPASSSAFSSAFSSSSSSSSSSPTSSTFPAFPSSTLQPTPSSLPPTAFAPSPTPSPLPSGAGAGGAGGAGGASPWALTQEETKRFSEIFDQLDVQRQGTLGGGDLMDFLFKTGLPQPLLGAIWTLSDHGGKGCLTKREFLISMKLVNLCLVGVPLPPSLPAELIQSVQSNTGAPGVSPADQENFGVEGALKILEKRKLIEAETKAIQDLEVKIESIQMDIDDLRKRKFGVEDELRGKERMKDSEESKRREAEIQIEEYQSKVRSLQATVERQRGEIDQKTNEYRQQEAKMARMQIEVQRVNETLGKEQLRIQGQLNDVQRSLAPLRTQAAEIEAQKNSIMAAIQAEKQNIERVKSGQPVVPTDGGFGGAASFPPVASSAAFATFGDTFGDAFGGGSIPPAKTETFASGFDDAFGGGSFGSSPSAAAPQKTIFDDAFGSSSTSKASFDDAFGGDAFGTKISSAPAPALPAKSSFDPFGGDDPFGSSSSFATPSKPSAAAASSSSSLKASSAFDDDFGAFDSNPPPPYSSVSSSASSSKAVPPIQTFDAPPAFASFGDDPFASPAVPKRPSNPQSSSPFESNFGTPTNQKSLDQFSSQFSTLSDAFGTSAPITSTSSSSPSSSSSPLPALPPRSTSRTLSSQSASSPTAAPRNINPKAASLIPQIRALGVSHTDAQIVDALARYDYDLNRAAAFLFENS